MATATRPPFTRTPPPTAEGCQTIQEYAAGLLRYAMNHGPYSLDGEQLRLADSAAQLAVMTLPKELSRADGTEQLNAQLAETRTRIQKEQIRRAQQWARIAAQLAGMETDPDTDQDVIDQDAAQAAQETDADRAAKLLRAALMLIMGPGPGNGGGGGGRPVRPTPPAPTTPPRDGRALSLPGTPTTSRRGDDDIPF